MVFEIGKYYEHTTGEQISIVGELETTQYGKCLIAESNMHYSFEPVGREEDNAQNWHEISREKWMKNFS